MLEKEDQILHEKKVHIEKVDHILEVDYVLNDVDELTDSFQLILTDS